MTLTIKSKDRGRAVHVVVPIACNDPNLKAQILATFFLLPFLAFCQVLQPPGARIAPSQYPRFVFYITKSNSVLYSKGPLSN